MKENIIKTIEIEIGGTLVKITPEQLLDLHSAIGELLNLKTKKVIEREIIRDRYVPHSQPIWYWYPNIFYSKSIDTNNDKFKINYSNLNSTANIFIK